MKLAVALLGLAVVAVTLSYLLARAGEPQSAWIWGALS